MAFADTHTGARGSVVAVGLAVLAAISGCAVPGTRVPSLEAQVASAARPLLEMDPEANWTACYNRLLELGWASIDYVASQPAMRRRAAPDDLGVMLHCSLLRMLASPGGVPRLSVNCFETTLNVLHFDPKVGGRRLGRIYLPTRELPRAWHDLYPADFDHALAGELDIEGDRRAMLDWWRAERGETAARPARRRLRPRFEDLRDVLARRYADVWTLELESEVYLCDWPPTGAALLRGKTHDYNLVRAACIWLVNAETPGALDELIGLVGDRSPIVAYNARFALRRSPDPRIREVLERYKEMDVPTPATAWYNPAPDVVPRSGGVAQAFPSRDSCDEQGSATHEVDQVCRRLCVRNRDGHLHRSALRWH